MHWRSLREPARPFDLRSRAGRGRICLLLAALGKIGAGAVIMTVGMTSVFVPSDLDYLGLSATELAAVNPRLVPLIAHDRAGFGGGLLSCGLIVLLIVWKAPITLALWQALLVAGAVGFFCALGVHFMVGYLDFLHLAPAGLGALVYLGGMAATVPWRR